MRQFIKISCLVTAVLSLSLSAYALTATESLGSLIYRDSRLSVNSNQSCMTCHHPSAGFSDPVNRRDPVNFPVSEGSIAGLYGGRNAPGAAYAGFAPIFHWDSAKDGYVGGMFWDGRATGGELGDPLAEQALGPFQNPVEMGLTPAEVVARVSTAAYADQFVTVYPETDWSDVAGTFNNIARAIAAFERSESVTRFSSQFDQFWSACQTVQLDVGTIGVTTDVSEAPQGILNSGQLRGLALFNSKAGCAACHRIADHDSGVTPPLFTDYTYANLGLPVNPVVEELSGVAPPDLGLGGRLDDAAQNGKFKVPTLRNVFKSPPYGHNGYFVTLEEMVDFLNSRDVPGSQWYAIAPEVSENINRSDVGNLGMSAQETGWLVAFLKSLTDQGR